MKRIALFCLLFGLVALSSCEKDDPAPHTEDEQLSPGTGSRNELTLDSIFLYARQVYLWHNSLPSYAQFAPRTRYANSALSEIEVYRQELFDMAQYAVNPSNNKPYELEDDAWAPRYSSIQTKTGISGLLAASTLTGTETLGPSGNFEVGTTKVAYLALNGFPLLSDIKTALDSKFAAVAQDAPSIMIIDLRNNPGGYVETAAHIANLIAPNSANGKLMYTERFNSRLQNANARILQFQPYLDSSGKPVQYQGRAATMADVDYSEKANSVYFSKEGSLTSLRTLYFIVSGTTASAAELLISALKPYISCVLVGERSYGKPVGFFPIHIDQYSLYLASFSLHNAEGWGDYYNGMEPDISVPGLANGDQGNPTEPALKAVLAAIQGDDKSATPRGSVARSLNMNSPSTKRSTAPAFIPIVAQPPLHKH